MTRAEAVREHRRARAWAAHARALEQDVFGSNTSTLGQLVAAAELVGARETQVAETMRRCHALGVTP